jgi:phosphoglycerol transferase MdoB-like AlkP superfamily enzyme
VPYNRLEEKIPNAFAYTDECLGKLIDGLKQTDLWENLLIVCIPDHGFCYPQGTTDRGGEFSHIPMLWLGGAIKEPMKIDKIMNQTDMAATLLGQLGLDYSMFPFSRNVLSDSYVYPFAFYTSSSVFAFRDSTGVTAYDLKGERISWEEPSASEDRLNRGKAILQSAYDELGKR